MRTKMCRNGESMENGTLFLRLVDKYDKNLILEWANDKLSRENSFSSAEISEEVHEKWFDNILSSCDNKLFVMMNGEVPVGQIRLEILRNSGTVSYSIDNKYRGYGFGKIILELLEDWISFNYDTEFIIIGYVKTNNTTSGHIFESLDFMKSENSKYIKYSKQIIPKHR